MPFHWACGIWILVEIALFTGWLNKESNPINLESKTLIPTEMFRQDIGIAHLKFLTVFLFYPTTFFDIFDYHYWLYSFNSFVCMLLKIWSNQINKTRIQTLSMFRYFEIGTLKNMPLRDMSFDPFQKNPF